MKNNFLNKENFDIWISPVFCVILTIILFFLNIYLGIIGLLASVISLAVGYEIYKKRKEELKEYVDKLDMVFDGFAKKAIFTMPFPIAIIGEKDSLVWYNSGFKEMFDIKSSLVERNINDLIPDFINEYKNNKDGVSFKLDFGLKNYEVHHSFIKDDDGGQMLLAYFIDISESEAISRAYEDEKLVLMSIDIDNYDELSSHTKSERRPIFFAELDRIISAYFHQYGSVVKKLENDKYFALVQKFNFDQMKEDKFSFSDKIKEVKEGNEIPATLSIGVGTNEVTARENERSANAALDIALGRGGDQLVLKSGENLEYFGGKNRATEKRTKVKARVIAHALGQLIDKSTEVFVMGHKNPDMDSYGSALGLAFATMRRNKKVYLVLSEVTPAIRNIYKLSVEKLEGLEEAIISPDEAYNLIKPSSLIIVTDNHRRNSTEEPRLFEKSGNVVVIDHHRRGKDYINNAILSYTEPYASSASELVTEMLMYMESQGVDTEIHRVVAEGLLAGIMVDTKNFFYQTGVRTFEAASVLKRHGADTVVVKQLFKDDLDIIRYKSEIIAQASIYEDVFIIGIFDKEMEGSTLIASQAADELLNIEGIKASFVMTRDKGKTHISARSLGDVSVQLIMEKLGGGGHLTVSATQLDKNIEEALDMLKGAIKAYSEEEKE